MITILSISVNIVQHYHTKRWVEPKNREPYYRRCKVPFPKPKLQVDIRLKYIKGESDQGISDMIMRPGSIYTDGKLTYICINRWANGEALLRSTNEVLDDFSMDTEKPIRIVLCGSAYAERN